MPIKKLTLGLALLLTGSVLAQHPAHSSGGYVVKDGENDWIIAHRHHLTVPQLRALNPDIRWSALHPGEHLHVVASQKSAPAHRAATTPVRVASRAAAKAQTTKVQPTVVSSTRAYVVQDGENDWIIAHRAGITTVALKRVNPGVNLSHLRTGQKIRLPGGAVARSLNKIHSRYAVINGDSVNIRREPRTSSDEVTQVDSGTRVVILDRDGEWYRLRFPHGTEGWVRGGLLKAVAEPRVARVSHRRHKEDDGADEHVASRTHRRPTYASSAHGGGRHSTSEAWSAADISDAGEAGGKILERAAKYRGERYQWGSMSRSATDCSGFTSQVFKSEGFTIPRTSREQSSAGVPVHSKDLKPGDLVFFHTMRGARVTHVGIYMGHGKFIHASSAGGHVQVNRLDEGYYQHRLVAARRIVKHKPIVHPQSQPKHANPPATHDDVVTAPLVDGPVALPPDGE
jgi:cell wall-associated NlpC family hydrolase/LysM repeat protein